MRIQPVPAQRIPSEWGWMSELLRPAIDLDPQRDETDVLALLESGRMSVWLLSGPARGVVVTQIAGEDFWIIYAAGQIDGPTKQSIKAIRSVVGAFEVIAQGAACSSLRLEGRNWGVALRDYQTHRLENGRYELRKALV